MKLNKIIRHRRVWSWLPYTQVPSAYRACWREGGKRTIRVQRLEAHGGSGTSHSKQVMCFLKDTGREAAPAIEVGTARMCQNCMWQMVAWDLQQEALCLLLYVQGTRFQSKHFRMLTTQTHFQTQKRCVSYHSVREAFVLSHKAAVSWHCWITTFSWPSLNFGRELAIWCMRIFSSSNPSRSFSSLSSDFFLEYGI